jgi:hypothetical protein
MTHDIGDEDPQMAAYQEAEMVAEMMMWTVHIAGDVWQNQPLGSVAGILANVQMHRPVVGNNDVGIRVIAQPRDVKAVAEWPFEVSDDARSFVQAKLREEVRRATQVLMAEELDRPFED